MSHHYLIRINYNIVNINLIFLTEELMIFIIKVNSQAMISLIAIFRHSAEQVYMDSPVVDLLLKHVRSRYPVSFSQNLPYLLYLFPYLNVYRKSQESFKFPSSYLPFSHAVPACNGFACKYRENNSRYLLPFSLSKTPFDLGLKRLVDP